MLASSSSSGSLWLWQLWCHSMQLLLHLVILAAIVSSRSSLHRHHDLAILLAISSLLFLDLKLVRNFCHASWFCNSFHEAAALRNHVSARKRRRIQQHLRPFQMFRRRFTITLDRHLHV
ncbi:hypothetical protein O6H91_07G075000 [Diphasiastrum complanatum]|uniref:Uncharacterized protein n=1 Tax=Diphasiastrum complanatum TaxID=34168 RepID=A0ACC2D6K6_DIPCM|nr:hypothetical protein O6H91_Y160300 [Diphasiastrum complanatum]KAJ7549916.1 hypothetical protein O6H91_07G075000 [Diphasiastrum complanatum]